LPGKVRRKAESLKHKLEAIILRIPITPTTVTAALLLTQQIIELARVCKVPLQVEKVATLDIAPVAPAHVEAVTAEIKVPMVEEQK
jgi:hypothetical protein